jgi:ubiquitin C-terminal hydrolase
MESREEKYTLRFIIVHRGEADSGHYWGYGFTGGCWWRYDINNSKVEKDTMIKEIENGNVVVYALIYGRYDE